MRSFPDSFRRTVAAFYNLPEGKRADYYRNRAAEYPRRCVTGECNEVGDCEVCSAIQGEACRAAFAFQR